MTEHKSSTERTAKEIVKHKTLRLTVSYAMYFPEYAPFASLRIKGKWLEAAGFTTGTPVEIVVEDGRMVMTALTKPEKPAVKEVESALAVRKTREFQRVMARIEKKRG